MVAAGAGRLDDVHRLEPGGVVGIGMRLRDDDGLWCRRHGQRYFMMGDGRDAGAVLCGRPGKLGREDGKAGRDGSGEGDAPAFAFKQLLQPLKGRGFFLADAFADGGGVADFEERVGLLVPLEGEQLGDDDGALVGLAALGAADEMFQTVGGEIPSTVLKAYPLAFRAFHGANSANSFCNCCRA